MKIIFLDIDGVISTSPCWGVGSNNKWGVYMFDTKCVAVLNLILRTTGAEIILTSDWRTQHTLLEMCEIFTHNGVIKGPMGFTPSMKSYNSTNLEGGRVDEIKSWLHTHAWKDDIKWVAIDDLNMGIEYAEKMESVGGGLKNFVHCPRHTEGIKQCGVKDKILKLLI
jgi:hypothetical protein